MTTTQTQPESEFDAPLQERREAARVEAASILWAWGLYDLAEQVAR